MMPLLDLGDESLPSMLALHQLARKRQAPLSVSSGEGHDNKERTDVRVRGVVMRVVLSVVTVNSSEHLASTSHRREPHIIFGYVTP